METKTIEYADGLPDEPSKPNPFWKVAIVGVPLFLLLSSAWAMWIWWKESQDDSEDPRLALAAGSASVEEIQENLDKLSGLLERRDWNSASGRKKMRYAIAFIDGTLSPRNYGFTVQTGEHLTYNEELWPTVWVDLTGVDEPNEVVLVTAAYDLNEENPSIALLLAAANDLRDEKFARTIRFVFHPSVLYAAEGKKVAEVLEEDEVAVATLSPELGETDGAEDSAWTAALLQPMADAFAEKVRVAAE